MQDYVFDYEQYQKKLNKKVNISFVFLFVIIIILSAIFSALNQPKIKTYEYHFIELNHFENYTQANEFSTQIKQVEGAGFIYKDDYYHVFANYYIDKENAEKVCKNLKNDYKNCKIYTISAHFPSNFKNLSINQNTVLKNILNNLYQLNIDLAELSLDYDTQKITYNSLCLKLKNLTENFTKNVDDFNNFFKANSSVNFVKDYLLNTTKNLNSLCSNLSEQNIKFNIKFSSVNTALNHYFILSNF